MSVVSSRTNGSARLDDAVLRKPVLKASLRGKSEQRPEVTAPDGVVVSALTPRELASVLFDQACLWYGQKNDSLAATISEATGHTVSESIVGKWRKPHEREMPSYAQIVALGPEFQRLLKKAESRHHGWARKALMELAEAMADVAGCEG